MTKAEASLWKYVLRARGMKGYLFRRQRPVLQYIADFMCQELKLILEIDGSSHDSEEDLEKDRKRDKDLEQAGYRVLRIRHEDVLTRLDGVRSCIEGVIENIEEPTPRPLSSGPPPPAGDKRDEPNRLKG